MTAHAAPIVTPNAEPRPDLAGQLLKSPASPTIYLVDAFGELRAIPDEATFNNLFNAGKPVTTTTEIPSITRGLDFTSGAILAKGSTETNIYLITNGHKNWLNSLSVLSKYFASDKVVVVLNILIDSIPDGKPWS